MTLECSVHVITNVVCKEFKDNLPLPGAPLWYACNTMWYAFNTMWCACNTYVAYICGIHMY